MLDTGRGAETARGDERVRNPEVLHEAIELVKRGIAVAAFDPREATHVSADDRCDVLEREAAGETIAADELAAALADPDGRAEHDARHVAPIAKPYLAHKAPGFGVFAFANMTKCPKV